MQSGTNLNLYNTDVRRVLPMVGNLERNDGSTELITSADGRSSLSLSSASLFRSLFLSLFPALSLSLSLSRSLSLCV